MNTRKKYIMLFSIILGIVLFVFSRIEVHYGIIEKMIHENTLKKEAEAKAIYEAKKYELELIKIKKADAERKACEEKIKLEKAETDRIAAMEKKETERRETEAKIIAYKIESDRIAKMRADAERKAYEEKIKLKKAETDRIVAMEKTDANRRKAESKVITDTENIDKNVLANNSRAVSVNSRSKSSQKKINQSNSPQVIRVNTRNTSKQYRDYIVLENVRFKIDGIVIGNITLKRNSTLIVNGKLVGNVYNYGGKIIQNTKIQGRMINYLSYKKITKK